MLYENIIGKIGMGFNVLIGISKDDTLEDLKYIKDKKINLRVFNDENDKMNLRKYTFQFTTNTLSTVFEIINKK